MLLPGLEAEHQSSVTRRDPTGTGTAAADTANWRGSLGLGDSIGRTRQGGK